MSMMGQIKLDCVMPSSPDSLRVLFARFAFMAWKTALESAIEGLLDIG